MAKPRFDTANPPLSELPQRAWNGTPYRPVLRTIVGQDQAGQFHVRFPPIEQDWDHVIELLTVEEAKP